MPGNMRPATPEEFAEDYERRRQTLMEAERRGTISKSLAAVAWDELANFRGYLRRQEETEETPMTNAYIEAHARMSERFIAAATAGPPSPDQRDTVATFQETAVAFAAEIEMRLPEGRDKALALTHLEDALMRANRAVFTTGLVD